MTPSLDAAACFMRLAEAGTVGVVTRNVHDGVLEINDAALTLLGYTREEMLSGRVAWENLTPPEWQTEDGLAAEQLASAGVGALLEKEFVRKDGRRVPVLVGSAMVPGGAPLTLSFIVDLSERKLEHAAQERLRETLAMEAHFRALLETAPDAIVIVDANRVITLINGQTEALFGYVRAELVGRPIELLIPRRFHERHRAHGESYVRDHRVRPMGAQLQLYGQRKDGSEFPVEVSLSPLQTAAGLLVSSAIRDITERKRADEQRASLAALVDASDDAIIGKSLEGIVVSWNEGAHRLFGYAAAEIIGQPISVIVPADREPEWAQNLAAVGAGEVRRIDTVRRRKDGVLVDVSLTISPVRDSFGKVISISKVARDVGERRRSERELATAKEAAEAASRELEAFSYSVAHDLRAPLRAMNDFAQMLLAEYGGKFDDTGEDWLNEILLNAKRMGHLIDALLSLSRVTRSELHPARVDLSNLARLTLSELAGRDPQRRVTVTVQDHLLADADAALTRALLENLLGNAWKFTSKVEHAQITVGATEREGEPVFYVRDNGAGFDMAYARKLFAPFQRLHSERDFSGTGIGLSTVQRIVHRHRGRIWAESSPNEGATFYFTLRA